MAHIAGSIRIAAPPQQVFDTVADSRLEPSFNPAMSDVELLTAEPIGKGSRFRARMTKASADMLIELTDFDPPRRLSSRTTSSIMETTGTLTCASDAEGTVLSWDWQVRPMGWYRPMGPLVRLLGPGMERRIWTGLKHKLESDSSPTP